MQTILNYLFSLYVILALVIRDIHFYITSRVILHLIGDITEKIEVKVFVKDDQERDLTLLYENYIYNYDRSNFDEFVKIAKVKRHIKFFTAERSITIDNADQIEYGCIHPLHLFN